MITGWPCGQRYIERALDLEKPASVMQRADARRIEVEAGRRVGHDCPVVPAIPQPLDDIDELVPTRVAQRMVHVPLAAEIQRALGEEL